MPVNYEWVIDDLVRADGLHRVGELAAPRREHLVASYVHGGVDPRSR